MLCALTLNLSSCLDATELKGYHPGIIPRDSMVSLLVDIQLVESYRNLRYLQGAVDSASNQKVEEWYLSVLKRHGVSAQRFDSSYSFYQAQDPVILDGMYQEVNTRLSEQLSQQP